MRPAVPKTLNVCEKIQTTTMTIRCLLLKWFLPSLLCSIVSFAIILISLEGAFMLFWDFYDNPSYDVPVSVDRIRFVIDSVAQTTMNKPQYAIEWEKLCEGYENNRVIYLPNAKACVYFGIESTNGGAKITPWKCQINPEYRMRWYGESPGHGISFHKAHKMEKDFEEYVLKKNNIPFEKHKPFSSYLARLMMYPLAFMWQTFLFIFVLVFTWIYFERSKRWKQEK